MPVSDLINFRHRTLFRKYVKLQPHHVLTLPCVDKKKLNTLLFTFCTGT